MVKRTKQVIIGNSIAALNAVKAIRRYDTSCQVIVISAENYLAYSPVLLPYYLSGKIKKNQMTTAGKDFYRHNAVNLLLGKEAASVDTKSQRVILKDESIVEYDNLLIASGASAKKPKYVSENMPNVMTLRTMDDAERILEASKDAKDVLIIGAGLVGLEVANALQERDRKITIMAKSNQILSKNSDPECASIIQKGIEESGVSFLFGRDVREIIACGDKIRVLTDRDDEIMSDMVVFGKGVISNTQFVEDTDIRIDNGILVNGKMATNIANVYAAGDVAQTKNLITGGYDLFANWPSACIEGEIAGLNMVGQKAELLGEVNYNILPIFNMTAAFMGETKANSLAIEVLKCYDEKKGAYRKILTKENKIIGVILLGSLRDVGIILNLITKCMDISRRKNELAFNSFSWGKILHDAVYR